MTQAQAALSSEGGALSRDLAEFLVELAIAMHKTAIYPAGHPLLETAVDGVARKLGLLLRERPTLSIGVARRQLVIEGVATDPNHPLLRELAQRFHRHHLGALRFSSGVVAEEIADVLATVSAAVDTGAQRGEPVGLGPPEALARWEHIRLFPLTYEQLQLLEGEEDTQGEGTGGTRGAQLWVGLARAAMMAESTAAVDAANISSDPEDVAKAIDEHQSDAAYDQVIVGYLLQIAQELNTTDGGAEAPALQARVSRMVASLDPKTLRRLLEMGGNMAQRKRFVTDASRGMKPEAVIDLVKAAAESSNQTISHSLLRMFNKLAVHAEKTTGTMKLETEAALRDNVQRLIGNWGLDDPNPDQYTGALDAMARSTPTLDGSDAGGVLEAERVLQMSLETGAVGDMVWLAVDGIAEQGRIGELLDMVDSAPDSRAVAAIRGRVATQDNLRRALEQTPVDVAVAERMVQPLGLAAAEPLLDALDALDPTDERTARELSDLLVALGSDGGEAVAGRLPFASWVTQRRLLSIIARIPALPEGFVPSDYTLHPDSRVRLEALRLMLTRESHRERALRTAISDSDEQMQRAGLMAALDACPASVVPVILRRLSDRDLSSELRVLGIRVLAASKARTAVDYLMDLTVRKRRVWGRRLAAKNPEVLAALTGLSHHWAQDGKVKGVIALAMRSGDPEVRAAVTVSEKRR